MIPYLLALGVGAIAAFAVRVVTRPDRFEVERSELIQAPPERVYALLANFREWTRWSPWEKLDPNLSRTYSGADGGVGSVYEWSGNKKAGAGRMEIIEADPAKRILVDLEFIKPFVSRNKTEFLLEPRSGGTQVIWRMEGPSTTTSKMIQSVVSMDRMVGRDFERGLASMKEVAETVSA